MTVIAAVAVVMAVVQFAKKALPTVIQGAFAVGIVVVASAGVTVYKYIAEGLPFTFAAVTFLIQVVVGAMGAYGLVKAAAGEPK